MSHITYKSKFYNATNYDGNLGNFRVKSQIGTATFRYTFQLPHDLKNIISAKLLGNISAGAAQSGRDIDIFIDAHQEGQAYNQKTASDVSSTYDLSSSSGLTYAFDITSLIPTPTAGDLVGLAVDHNAIGGTIYYFGIELIYS